MCVENSLERCFLRLQIAERLVTDVETSYVLLRVRGSELKEVQTLSSASHSHIEIAMMLKRCKYTFKLKGQSEGEEENGIEELHSAFMTMRAKLTKYYTGTFKSSVYDDEMILDSRLKLYLTTQSEWSDEQNESYFDADYSFACRNRYIQQYEKFEPHFQFTIASKKTFS